jgi:hypothetical protein
LFQDVGYTLGQSYAFASGLSTYRGANVDWLINGGQVSSQQPVIQNLSLHVDGQGLAPFMTGQYVPPNFVSSQVRQADRNSDGRTERANSAVSPGALTDPPEPIER